MAAQLTRRSMLEGMGFGALGLAGAALLGCGGGSGGTAGTGQVAAEKSGQVTGGTSGFGLPVTAPKVEGRVKEGGVYTAGGGATTQVQFDPGTALGNNIFHTISEKGLEPHPVTGKILPHTFTSWEVADPQGTTLVFKMHPKLFMAPADKPPWNGRQFTAEDAAWNLERIGGLYAERLKIPLASFQRASMVQNIQKAVAVDPLTVRVTLSKPNSAFFNGLMENRVPFMPREMDDIGFTDPMKMAGYGPFYVTEWVTDVRTVFQKNPRYNEFRPGEPHFDTYRTISIPDAVASQSAFFSGQIATISVDEPDTLAAVRRGRPDANLYTTVHQNWSHLRPSFDTYPPFKDYRVRHAMHLAFDYKKNGDAKYGVDGGWVWQGPLNPMFPEAWTPDRVKAMPGYNPDTKAADIAEGQKLMTAAGYPNGKGIEYEIIHGGATNDLALRWNAYMAEAFPEMKAVPKPLGGGATFANRQAEGDFRMLAYSITLVPDAVLELISQYRTGGSRNYGHFTNPDSDRILDRAIGELNFDARKQLLDDYQQKWYSEWRPMFVAHTDVRKFMLQGNIGGYDTTWGPWFGYGTSTKVCRWYYVEK
jgi:ABC-type transport system substrate-binding protein